MEETGLDVSILPPHPTKNENSRILNKISDNRKANHSHDLISDTSNISDKFS